MSAALQKDSVAGSFGLLICVVPRPILPTMEAVGSPVSSVTLHRAAIADARRIQQLVNAFAAEKLMLPRPLHEILATIRDFHVARVDGEFAGCVALHIDLEDLAEIRSLAVAREFQHLGIGRRLIEAALDDARALGVHKVYALTFIVDFFKRFGFREIPKSELPNKVWADCVHCPLFPECKETALILDLRP